MTPLPAALIERENAVLTALRGCQTISAVEAVMSEVADEVKAIAVEDPVFQIIARNLVKYTRLGLSEGWLPKRACEAGDAGLKKSEPVKGSNPRTGSNATPLSKE